MRKGKGDFRFLIGTSQVGFDVGQRAGHRPAPTERDG